MQNTVGFGLLEWTLMAVIRKMIVLAVIRKMFVFGLLCSNTFSYVVFFLHVKIIDFSLIFEISSATKITHKL